MIRTLTTVPEEAQTRRAKLVNTKHPLGEFPFPYTMPRSFHLPVTILARRSSPHWSKICCSRSTEAESEAERCFPSKIETKESEGFYERLRFLLIPERSNSGLSPAGLVASWRHWEMPRWAAGSVVWHRAMFARQWNNSKYYRDQKSSWASNCANK